MRCDREGGEVILSWVGRVYAVVPGTPLRQLFTVRGMNVARCLRRAGTWHLASRELMYYLAPDVDADGRRASPLERWDNPWTHESVPVVHVANRLVQNELRGPLPALDDGTNVTVTIDVPLFYPNALATGEARSFSPSPSYQAAEMFTFTTSSAALQAATSSVDALTFSWHRIGPWLPWMNMGERSGYLLYSAYGRKITNIETLDEPLRSAVRDELTLYQHAPTCIVDAPNETSWTYFARHVSDYRRGARFPLPQRTDPSECGDTHPASVR